MKIVVLNASFLTPEHLSALRELGELQIRPDTASREVALERLGGAEVAIGDCNLVEFDRRFFESAHGLKLLVLNSTGYDAVDTQAAADNHVQVANAAGFSTQAVAEFTFALMLGLIRRLPIGLARMRKNVTGVIDSDKPEDLVFEGFELRGKTLGLVGLGNIGKHVADIANGFGMTVVAYNRTNFSHSGVKQVHLDDLLRQSDVVSLHMAAAPGNRHLIDSTKLRLMKPSAVIINTARASLINTADLIQALQSGRLAGAALDVVEPGPNAEQLIALENVIATPHVAFYTKEAIKNLADIMVANIAAYAAGKPQNIVSEAKS